MAQESNRFYIDTKADLGGAALDGMRMGALNQKRQQEKADNERRDAGRAAAAEARTDAQKLEVMRQFPELAEEMQSSIDYFDDISERRHLDTYSAIKKAGGNQQQSIQLMQDHIKTLRAMGIDTAESEDDLKRLLAGPMTQQEINDMAEVELMGHEDYRNQQKDARQGESNLAKLIRERAKLSPGDPMAARYDTAIEREADGSKGNNALEMFNQQIEGLSAPDQLKAKRIWAGLDPRAVKRGDSVSMVGNVPYLVTTDPQTGKTVVQQMSLDTGEVLDAQAVAENRGTTKAGEVAGAQAVEQSGKDFEKIAQIKAGWGSYNDAITAIDAGAESGSLTQYLPSFRQSTKELENAVLNAGFNVLAGASLGAISAGEFAAAMAKDIPVGMEGPELKAWLQRKMAAQQKVVEHLERRAIYLGTPGGTPAKWAAIEKGERLAREAGEAEAGAQNDAAYEAAAAKYPVN